jgi:transposase
MNLLELSALIQDEKKCEEYLRTVGILKNFTNCLKCNSLKIGRVRRNRWKCYDCNYEWHIRRNSILNLTKLDLSIFIALLKNYANEVSIEKCSTELKISESVVSNLFKMIRASISNLDFESFKSMSRRETITDRNPLIKIAVKENKIGISKVLKNDLSAIASNCVILSAKLFKNDKNQICYDYNLKHSQSMLELDHRPIDEIDRFWRHAKPKLIKQFISREWILYLYLNELVLRHNHEGEDYFDLIIPKIAQNTWVADYWGSLSL